MLSAPLKDNDPRLGAFISAQIASGEIYGRGAVLSEFITHIQSKPSLGLTRAWLQQQLEQARSTDADATQLESALGAVIARQDAKVIDFYRALQPATLKRGEARGRAQELILLTDNFSAYADEVAQADERDREARARFRAALGGFARGLQTNPGWTAQCTSFGHTLTCNGR